MQVADVRNEAIRTALEQGDYARAAAAAAELAPGMEPQLEQFRLQMELYEECQAAGEWRRTLRALADARLAAIAAGLPELESVVSDRLYQVVKHYEGRRA